MGGNTKGGDNKNSNQVSVPVVPIRRYAPGAYEARDVEMVD